MHAKRTVATARVCRNVFHFYSHNGATPLLAFTVSRRYISGGTALDADVSYGQAGARDEGEHGFFQKMSGQWWKTDGNFQPLHAMNRLRVPLIRDSFLAYCSPRIDAEAYRNNAVPFAGTKILDVGCGGGILSEPLARLGGDVTGIDMVAENVRNARAHWTKSLSRRPNPVGSVEYSCSTLEELSQEETSPLLYDIVVCSEVVEHVKDLDGFISAVSAVVKPGGLVVVTTINRTVVSWAAAIVGAEYAMRLVPKGTHHYGKFVTPEELGSKLRRYAFDVRLKHGMRYSPLSRRWSWAMSDAVNYAMVAVKNVN
ncbi:hypothetical protein RvY_11285 [Ramazzottius varieornatus]|uniref:Ubiquinone biosynthesis O-methyltransferase, mitochondrial n=1 Tax=Ramazzottius varieornatus TaxID=947166 RepID=A0A1D1VL24_RAMVA|nr:hypothetical protein RvY_11285 [Ramazzottius varieornatus]